MFSSIVEPPTAQLTILDPNVFHRGTVRTEPVRHDDFWPAVALHCTYVDAPLGASRNLGNSWHAVRHCRMSGLSECGICSPRACMVCVDRIQIASAVCFDSPSRNTGFPTPSLRPFAPTLSFVPTAPTEVIRASRPQACPRSSAFQFRTAFLFPAAMPQQRPPPAAGSFPS